MVIYLQGSIPYDDGNNTINLSPPTSGIFKGVSLDAPTDSPGSGYGCPKGNGKNNVPWGAACELRQQFYDL